LRKDVTAGSIIVSVTGFNDIVVIVTGVITEVSTSEVTVECLQAIHRRITVKIVTTVDFIDVIYCQILLCEKIVHFIYNLQDLELIIT